MDNKPILYLTNLDGSIAFPKAHTSGPADKAISPEWLESKGFVRYKHGKEYDIECFPPACFDVNFGEEDFCYIEAKIDRKQFCIVLTPDEYDDAHVKFYSFDVYIMEDIGCGFVNIPNQFCEMTEYHFSLLYEAIRRKKL